MEISSLPITSSRSDIAPEPLLLSTLCAAAALCELALNRLFLGGFSDSLSYRWLFPSIRTGMSLQTLVAISGIIACAVASFSLLRDRGWAALWRRILLGLIAVTWIALSLWLGIWPLERTPTLWVFALATTTFTLGTLLVAQAWVFTNRVEERITLGFISLSAVLSLPLLLVRQVHLPLHLQLLISVERSLIQTVEFLYLSACLGFSIVLIRAMGAAPLRRVLSWLLAVVMLGGFSWFMVRLGSDAPTVLYGAQRLEWVVQGPVLLYAIPLCLALSLGIFGLSVRKNGTQHYASAALLWISAGVLPQSPPRMIMLGVCAFILAHITHRHTSLQPAN